MVSSSKRLHKPAAQPVNPVANGGAVATLRLFLAGLVDEAETASRLGLATSGFREMLADMSVSGVKPVPVDVSPDLVTTFLDISAQNFDASTYDMAVEAARSSNAPAAFVLPARALVELPPPVGCAMPDGIILHVGRCGSTLLCNMLARSGGWAALREPEFLNRLFLMRAAATEPERLDIDLLVERLLASLAHGMRPARCAVKLSSWGAAAIAGLLARRGDLRVAVVVRDPSATVASFLSESPHWSGAHPVNPAARSTANDARFFAEVWVSIVRTALLLPRERVLFLEYEKIVENPLSALGCMRRHFGDAGPITEADAVAASMRCYSKGAESERFDPAGRHRRAALQEDDQKMVAAITELEWNAVGALVTR